MTPRQRAAERLMAAAVPYFAAREMDEALREDARRRGIARRHAAGDALLRAAIVAGRRAWAMPPEEA